VFEALFLVVAAVVFGAIILGGLVGIVQLIWWMVTGKKDDERIYGP
jgi:hypothetical protein